MIRWRFVLSIALLMVAARCGADEPPTTYPDKSVYETFTLANGLRVVTRHLPEGHLVAITTAYDMGSSDDPAGREGLTRVLAEIAFLGASGEIPERSMDDVPSARPAGWNLVVNPTVTTLTEVATVQQFPGVLREVAARMRGASVSDAGYRTIQTRVRQDLARDYKERVDLALYFQSGAYARGLRGPDIARIASGAGVQKLSRKEALALTAERMVPANAVLCLAGNLSSLPIRSVLEKEFGSIPSGRKIAARAAATSDSSGAVIAVPSLTQPVGVVAVHAPALNDTIHPYFYFSSLLVGGHVSQRWGKAEAPLTTRFQYSIMDDPTLLRFYPALGRDATTPAALSEEYLTTLREVLVVRVEPPLLESVWRGVDWLLGGPVPPDLQGRVMSEGGALSTLATTSATRELWGGEAFWSKYRYRFRNAVFEPFQMQYPLLGMPTRQVRVLFVPAK